MVYDRLAVCVEISEESERQGVDPALAMAVGWHESRLRRTIRSHAGAIGPMQVLPRHWCSEYDEHNCNTIEAGVRALKTYVNKYELDEALCRYNAGNIGCESRRARRYSRVVRETYKRLEFFQGLLFS
jgi:soluble lytic murein transglycosylase-like protein